MLSLVYGLFSSSILSLVLCALGDRSSLGLSYRSGLPVLVAALFSSLVALVVVIHCKRNQSYAFGSGDRTVSRDCNEFWPAGRHYTWSEP